MAHKYGYSDAALAAVPEKLGATCEHLDKLLEHQQRNGRDYFVGDAVSAVDFYWANFAGMILPLGPEDNPMPDYMRATYENADAATRSAVSDRLLAHRDMMYQRHIALPLDF
jgi:glutathione S-transferase